MGWDYLSVYTLGNAGSQASINKALISVCLFVFPIITHEPKLTDLPQSFVGELDIATVMFLACL